VHPGAGHVAEAEGRGEAAEVGHVLGHHLGIEAAEAEEFDLFGAGDRVGVGHVDRGVGLEALGEAAASAAAKGLAGDVFDVDRVDGIHILCFLSGGDFHFAQGERGAHHMVIMLWCGHVVDRVVFIAYKAEYQTFIGGMDFDAVMALCIGDGADVANLPIDVDAL